MERDCISVAHTSLHHLIFLLCPKHFIDFYQHWATLTYILQSTVHFKNCMSRQVLNIKISFLFLSLKNLCLSVLVLMEPKKNIFNDTLLHSSTNCANYKFLFITADGINLTASALQIYIYTSYFSNSKDGFTQISKGWRVMGQLACATCWK